MKINILFLIFFGISSAAFIAGNVLNSQLVIEYSTYFLFPSIMGFYFSKAREIKYTAVIALLCIYVRDLVLMEGFLEFPIVNFGSSYLALLILIIYAITEFKKTEVRLAEYFSFSIIYGFSIFLFFSLTEIVQDSLQFHAIPSYIYLLLVCLFLSIGFTVYFLKSHLASLWLMLCASSIAFSESCYFLKIFVIEDFSVSLFYSLFHVFIYFSLAMFALNRRPKKLMFFN